MAEILIKHYTLKRVQMFTLISMNIISLSIVHQELGIQTQAKKIVLYIHVLSTRGINMSVSLENYKAAWLSVCLQDRTVTVLFVVANEL